MAAKVWIITLLFSLIATAWLGGQEKERSPEVRAISYLVREVPLWAKENKCYSCHNNGDAARTLFEARHLGVTVPDNALADTTQWLSKPEQWERNGGEGPFVDKQLARLQFTATLASAGAQSLRTPLRFAADALVADQRADGSWSVDTAQALGGPTTYGQSVATVMAYRSLSRADARRYEEPLRKAEQWLRAQKLNNVMDAAATLFALAGRPREDALDLLRKGQGADGGWGPYVNAPAESFDTALALLALAQHANTAGAKDMIHKGRRYLIAQQREDGSWPETTRPAGGDSYAQGVSTSAWATWALLVTRTK